MYIHISKPILYFLCLHVYISMYINVNDPSSLSAKFH